MATRFPGGFSFSVRRWNTFTDEHLFRTGVRQSGGSRGGEWHTHTETHSHTLTHRGRESYRRSGAWFEIVLMVFNPYSDVLPLMIRKFLNQRKDRICFLYLTLCGFMEKKHLRCKQMNMIIKLTKICWLKPILNNSSTQKMQCQCQLQWVMDRGNGWHFNSSQTSCTGRK